jgi:hypothetical protein
MCRHQETGIFADFAPCSNVNIAAFSFEYFATGTAE